MAVMRIDTQIPWRIDRAEGERWVGICDPLDLTVESETWAELMEDIALTLDAMLRDLLANNELESILARLRLDSGRPDGDRGRGGPVRRPVHSCSGSVA